MLLQSRGVITTDQCRQPQPKSLRSEQIARKHATMVVVSCHACHGVPCSKKGGCLMLLTAQRRHAPVQPKPLMGAPPPQPPPRLQHREQTGSEDIKIQWRQLDRVTTKLPDIQPRSRSRQTQRSLTQGRMMRSQVNDAKAYPGSAHVLSHTHRSKH